MLDPHPDILYLVTEDWYFCSHRLGLVRADRDQGAEVVVASRGGNDAGRIGAEDFRLSGFLDVARLPV